MYTKIVNAIGYTAVALMALQSTIIGSKIIEHPYASTEPTIVAFGWFMIIAAVSTIVFMAQRQPAK